jgi:alkanesulfonate monooxygenase SsuD/methylene tetrahydromethanopterin reductase-like flavin-dependent oxidoreductase (luciferase family)
MDLAAATAEVVFTAGQTLADARRFYADLKGRVAAAGRDPDSLKILPGHMPFVGRTEAEAQEIRDRVNGLVHIDVGMHVLSQSLGGVDLSAYPLDGPLPETLPPSNSSQSRRELIEKMARTEKLTIRQLAMRMASAAGHGTACGSAAQIADRMEEWVREGAADGFVVLPPMLPATCDSFVDLVVPELRRRGLFRKDYEGRTLRDHLGLKAPPSRFRI